jgi:hypothetical protein
MLSPLVLALSLASLGARGATGLQDDAALLRQACPDYVSYASAPQ